MTGAPAESDRDYGRVRWQCRRGLKELDVLLSRYAEAHYLSSSPSERATFRSLLDLHDSLIYGYCLGLEIPPDPHVSALIQRITAPPGNDR